MVYEGEFDTRVAAARALDNQVKRLIWERQYAAMLLPAEEAVLEYWGWVKSELQETDDL
jgi:hypothetical protein